MSDQDQLELQLAVIRLEWTGHRRRCAVCRRAQRARGGLCHVGRPLFYALEAAQALATAGQQPPKAPSRA